MSAVLTPPPPAEVRRVSAAPPAPRRRAWDIALTILLLIAAGGLSLVATLWGVLGMSVTGVCGPRECHMEVVSLGGLVGVFGPVFVMMAVSVTAIVRFAAGRIAFWVPLAGAALIVACPALQAVLLTLAIP